MTVGHYSWCRLPVAEAVEWWRAVLGRPMTECVEACRWPKPRPLCRGRQVVEVGQVTLGWTWCWRTRNRIVGHWKMRQGERGDSLRWCRCLQTPVLLDPSSRMLGLGPTRCWPTSPVAGTCLVASWVWRWRCRASVWGEAIGCGCRWPVRREQPGRLPGRRSGPIYRGCRWWRRRGVTSCG